MNKLRMFKGLDFLSFQGATDFPDGSKPMIATGKNATLIVSGFQDGTDGFGIDLIFDEDYKDISEAFKCYDDIERAKTDAMLFAQLLDCNITKEFLSDFGFEII